MDKKIKKVMCFKSIFMSENEINFSSYYHLWKASEIIPLEVVKNQLLTVDYLKWVNLCILNKKCDSVSQYNVKTKGTNKVYEQIESIKNSLYMCVDQFNVNKKFDELFFNFLNIHPFIDGNGRTIKLFISMLMSSNNCWKISVGKSNILSLF